jgi:LysM repeat protein
MAKKNREYTKERLRDVSCSMKRGCVRGPHSLYTNARSVFLVLLLIPFGILFVTAQKSATYELYINRYSSLAVQEAKKHQIPASITLAQALLESGAGQSLLARKSNNHFGIKCHEWKGDRFYKNAEKPNECFRKYKRVEDSYADHSLFLTERARYAPLFKFKKSDYAQWAKGLQSCGYATDRKYADKLISLIERYQLYHYDKGGGEVNQAVTEKEVPDLYEEDSSYEINKIYGLKHVLANNEDTFGSIAMELGLKAKKIAKFNEAPIDFPLRKGDIVYLEKKKKRAVKPNLNHQVQTGESMYSISQRYGLRVKNLYKMNHKTKDYVPENGDILKLR